MLYPKNIESKLGFDKIREVLTDNCVSPMGVKFVKRMSFSSEFDRILMWLEQTAEFKAILESGTTFTVDGFVDISTFLEKIKVEGVWLDATELFDIKGALNAISFCDQFFKDNEELYPGLANISRLITFDQSMILEIDRVIDESGEIRSNASPELQKIRKELIASNGALRKSLSSIFKKASSEGWVPENTSVTIRDGRMVIPINAESKKRIKGFVHDESATGKTVFLEPTEVLEFNNEIRELESREKREIIRILMDLTAYLRTDLAEIFRSFSVLGLVDFIRSKAKLALTLDAEIPELSATPEINLKNAQHPLLIFANQLASKEVVPLNLDMTATERVLLVSGPNAGGKSVCIKTVGLIQFMTQCGLLVPLHPDSKIGVFKSIFIDIGDEQSIENDLSTYSSHLKNMRVTMSKSDKDSLVLIDEFGTGTDPKFGGAIAEAILEQLVKNKPIALITTHYSNLKQLAENSDGARNAAMRFDSNKLEPLFELEIGRPGSSFALELARKAGLPKPVLMKAKELVGYDEVNTDRLLNRLETDKRTIEKQKQAIAKKEKEIDGLKAKYEQMTEEFSAKKKILLEEAKQKAASIIDSSNKLVEKTIRHIQENKAQKAETKKVRADLKVYREKVIKAEKQEKVVVNETGPIQLGDHVVLDGKGMVGEVTDVRGKDARISFGGLVSTLKMSRLTKVFKGKAKKHASSPRSAGLDLSQKLAESSDKLDIRGKRGEEVISLVDSFIDSGILFGRNELKIVHGKGDGILRKIVREHLRSYKDHAEFEDEHADRGGAGVTVVRIK